jgi:phage terminase large subunit-like protein
VAPVPLFDGLTPARAKEKARPWEADGLTRPERVAAFIESLTITSGRNAGQPFRLRPWQRDIIERIYGPQDDQSRRIVRTALLTMPRKNGKTGLAAPLALAHLFGPEAERRGQVYSAAADRNQAAIIYREMKAIIEADPDLSARAVIRDFTKHIEDSETGSEYMALSADAKTKHGFSANCVIYDELAQAPNRELYDVLTTSTGAREEPLVLVISTQTNDRHHVMTELVEYGRRVNDGIIDDPTFCAVIYEAPADANPWAEATWFACNPALSDFRSLQEMRTSAAQARRIPAREATFRNLYLNQPVDSDPRFIPATEWDGCLGEVDPAALRGRPCWGGLDLSSTRDLTALVLFFPEDDGAVLPFFWVPAESIAEREDRDRVPYRVWIDQNRIEATPGRAIDRRAIACRLAEITSAFDVRGIAYDRWRIEDLQSVLSDEGIDVPMVAWGQGFKDMAPAVDLLEAAILDRRLVHDGHPVLTWCVSNAVVQTDPTGARKLDKAKSVDRIDGLVALTQAIGLHAREPAEPDYSASIILV